MTIKDLDKMDDDFLNTKFDAMQAYIKSNLEYWKQIPKLYYILEGKSGYSSNYVLSEFKLFTLGSPGNAHGHGVLINCTTGDLVHLKTGNKIGLCLNDKYWKKDAVEDLMFCSSKIDGKRLVDYYNKEIDSKEHTTLNHILPREWISNAVEYNLDITYQDYLRHYDPNCEAARKFKYNKTEKEFMAAIDELTISIAKKELVEDEY